MRSQIKGVDKLNIGCGDNPVEGWINVGIFPHKKISDKDIPYGTLKRINNALILHLSIMETFQKI